MLLSLNSDKAAFWALVDPVARKLIVFLTFKDPGPKEVNYEDLNVHCKQIIDAGLEQGNIILVMEGDLTQGTEDLE
jgi:hypothetical protein